MKEYYETPIAKVFEFNDGAVICTSGERCSLEHGGACDDNPGLKQY